MVAVKEPISRIAKPKPARNLPKHADNPDLRRRRAEEIYFGKDAPELDWDRRLTPAEEVIAFQRMHFCAFRMGRVERNRALSPRQTERKLGIWRARYEDLRERLVNNNMGLVYEMLRRSRFRNADQDELLSEGLLALLRSVQTYDPWRGFRFSTYACNSILRSFIREAMKQMKIREQTPMTFDPTMEEADPTAWRRADHEALFAERLNRILDDNLADLSETEQAVLARRFPRDSNEKRLTLEKLGKVLNVSKERVRQIQKHALDKLRVTVTNDPILFEQEEQEDQEEVDVSADDVDVEADPSESGEVMAISAA